MDCLILLLVAIVVYIWLVDKLLGRIQRAMTGKPRRIPYPKYHIDGLPSAEYRDPKTRYTVRHRRFNPLVNLLLE